MKKIINGRKYDTEAATRLAVYDNGLGHNDLEFLREELYRKRTGEYFLYGEGGARSMYSGMDGDCYCGGEDIEPYTEDQAKAWVEEFANEKYEEIFGECEE